MEDWVDILVVLIIRRHVARTRALHAGLHFRGVSGAPEKLGVLSQGMARELLFQRFWPGSLFATPISKNVRENRRPITPKDIRIST
jgi:hypothetical protein